MGDRASIDAVRIAVGKKVFSKKCELSFQFCTRSPYIQFSYFHKDKQIQHPVYLKQDELKEVKYYIARDDDSSADDSFEPMTLIVFRITPTMKNKFDKYSNAYSQEDTEDEIKTDRRFISVEVRDAEDFQVTINFRKYFLRKLFFLFYPTLSHIKHYFRECCTRCASMRYWRLFATKERRFLFATLPSTL